MQTIFALIFAYFDCLLVCIVFEIRIPTICVNFRCVLGRVMWCVGLHKFAFQVEFFFVQNSRASPESIEFRVPDPGRDQELGTYYGGN